MNDGVDSKYLVYALNAVDYHELIFGSIIPKLTQSDMNRIDIPLPDICIQIKITSYLDTQCGIIDSQIEDRKKLVDKLTALKQSMIYEYVTGKKMVHQEVSV